jgi:hypothetical protein
VRKSDLFNDSAYPLFRLARELVEEPGNVAARMRALLLSAGNSIHTEP